MKTEQKTAKALGSKKMNSNTLLLVITVVLFAVMYAAGCVVYASKGFTHAQTFLNILNNNAGLVCVACGMTCVMLTGGIDISVGSLIALDCMLLAWGTGQGISAAVMCALVSCVMESWLVETTAVMPRAKNIPAMVTIKG